MSYELESNGGLAQLARALALQAKGHRFDSDILHKSSLHIDNGLRPNGSKPYYQLLLADSYLLLAFRKFFDILGKVVR